MREPFLSEQESERLLKIKDYLFLSFALPAVYHLYRYAINLHQRVATEPNEQQRSLIHRMLYQAAAGYRDSLYDEYNRFYEAANNFGNIIAPRNVVNVVGESITTLTTNIRNIPNRLQGMITARPINKVITIATWLHGIYLHRYFLMSRYKYSTRSPHLKCDLFLHICTLYFLSTLTDRVMDFVRREVSNFARRVRHRGLQPIYQLLSFKNIIATFCAFQEYVNNCV